MSAPDVHIRPLSTQEELLACVALQREIWGAEFTDVVPPSLLKVAQRVGGIAAGAFAPGGRLLGFVFGLTGVEGGQIVHWSDMLAVVADARNLGLGRQLKEYQRRTVRDRGARVIYWTYDPLVARNAHLNFNVFGVRVTEYVPEMYGDTASALHSGIGTDRFIVAWPTDDAAVRDMIRQNHAAGTDRALLESGVLNPARDGRGEGMSRDGDTPSAGRVEIPVDITEVQQQDPRAARRWRQSTREAFQRALGAGLVVRGFVVDACARRGYYLLAR
ncbi:MAG TPA: hypothetical protein VJU87_07735 [Gemmatimonadaceae bacterium]|nr:hypothetical protein [Gemmatimonadaceae bacterium]